MFAKPKNKLEALADTVAESTDSRWGAAMAMSDEVKAMIIKHLIGRAEHYNDPSFVKVAKEIEGLGKDKT